VVTSDETAKPISAHIDSNFLPEDDKVMPADVTVKVGDIYRSLSRAMDLPPAASWLDD